MRKLHEDGSCTHVPIVARNGFVNLLGNKGLRNVSVAANEKQQKLSLHSTEKVRFDREFWSRNVRNVTASSRT